MSLDKAKKRQVNFVISIVIGVATFFLLLNSWQPDEGADKTPEVVKQTIHPPKASTKTPTNNNAVTNTPLQTSPAIPNEENTNEKNNSEDGSNASEDPNSLPYPPADLPPDLKAQLNAPPPELPADLKEQLEAPPPELPEDLKAQLNAPPPPLPDDIKQALETPSRIVTEDEVNNPTGE